MADRQSAYRFWKMRVNPNMMITIAMMISSSGRPIDVLLWRVTSERSAESLAVSWARVPEHSMALARERSLASTLMRVPACSPEPI